MYPDVYERRSVLLEEHKRRKPVEKRNKIKNLRI